MVAVTGWTTFKKGKGGVSSGVGLRRDHLKEFNIKGPLPPPPITKTPTIPPVPRPLDQVHD